MYERCPMQLKLKAIDRLPELPRDPNNDPLARGDRIHKALEISVIEGAPPPKEAKEFADLLAHAHELYRAGRATVEQDWLSGDDWTTVERKDVWLWTKLDLNVVHEEAGHSIVVDYKTGKSQYKALEHIQQCQLYVAVAALRQPEVTKLTAELWYIDEKWVRTMEYTREQALKFIGLFDKRARPMFEEKLWRPRPNVVTCKWCPYSPRGTGACPVGV